MELTKNTQPFNRVSKYIVTIISIVALAMIAFQMVYSQNMFLTSTRYYNLHLGFSLIIIFLVAAQKSLNKIKCIFFLLLVLTVVFIISYVHIMAETLDMRSWFNTPLDLVLGTILIGLVLYSAYLSFGLIIPTMTLITVIYPFFGQYLPEPFTTISYPFDKTISNLSIGLKTGIYGAPLQTSADYVFLFVVFGGVLGATGLQNFFYEFGKLIVGRARSASGLMALINSALVGSITGSALANVTITGAYTIPSMKRAGYSPEQAAAIEASASNGGQIMPPIMGVIAFIMAGFTGIPYLKIVLMAIIPALLYFFCCGIYAHFGIIKNVSLRQRDLISQEKVNMRELLYRAPGFLVPLGLVIVLLSMDYSVMSVAFWAILTVMVVSFAVPKEYRPKLSELLQGFVSGAKSGAEIGAVSATVGLMITTFSGSGLGVKLSSGIEQWSGGHLFVALLILWLVSIVLGMVGVSTVAYFTSAAFAVPVLTKLGVPFEVAHFFIVFPSVFAFITPPVALAVMVAARLANANYLKASVETVKAAAAAFVLPFLFIYAPSLVLGRSAATLQFWVEIGVSVVIIGSLEIALIGYFLRNLNLMERAIWGVTPLMMVLYLIFREPYLLVFGLVALAIGFLLQFFWRKTVPEEKSQVGLSELDI